MDAENTPRRDTYEVTRADGSKTRVTVPENEHFDLFDAIREYLSPQAVAAIAWRLKFNNSSFTNDDNVDRQIRWFIQGLTELIGEDQRDRLAKELGL